MKLDSVIVEYLTVLKTKNSPRAFNVQSREHCSLSYRISGKNLISSGERELLSDAHSLTFVPASLPYSHNILTPSEQIVIHFTVKESIGDVIEVLNLPLKCGLEKLFYSLYQLWELEQRESNLKCMSLFYNILEIIAENLNQKNKREHMLLENSISYMHAHFKESDFNIEQLYTKAYISPAYYRRIFSKIYNCSPVEYLKSLRINYAKQLLKNGYFTVAEISELTGFSNPTYFSAEFKKETGCTPTEFR